MKLAYVPLLGALITAVLPGRGQSDVGPTLAESKAAFSHADLNRAYQGPPGRRCQSR
ncbi:MAG: hypothetical protein KDN20_22915 [Verrucomicrobiae bacterium]|nr:hypothetical protein [Verrucomicrobiae bacterium]